MSKAIMSVLPYTSVDQIKNDLNKCEAIVKEFLDKITQAKDKKTNKFVNINDIEFEADIMINEWHEHAYFCLGCKEDRIIAKEFFTTNRGAVNIHKRIENIFLKSFSPGF